MTIDIIEISARDYLWRRVPCTDPNYIKPDGRITSLAFTPRKQDADGLSVDIEKLTTYDRSVIDRKKFRLYRLQAVIPREQGLNCLHDPQPENPAHALMQGVFTKAISRKLASCSEQVAAS